MLGETHGEPDAERRLLASGRVAIERCRPAVDDGAHLPKATAGLPLEVSARILADGFDELVGWVRHGPPAHCRDRTPLSCPIPEGWTELPMSLVDGRQDRWRAWLTPPEVGPWSYAVIAMRDEYGTWLRDLRLRAGAGQDVALELEEGARIAERQAAPPEVGAADRDALLALAAELRAAGDIEARLRRAGEREAVALLRRTADRSGATTAGPFDLWVDRERAGFSAWYEFFPRSEGAEEGRSGSFASAARRLPAIAAMGFDTVYLPPIHPIGRTARRGPNNSDSVSPSDPGSPWGIGSEAGGHTAVHPDLGTLEDFDSFLAAAAAEGLEVALDYALQCSPEHPWVGEHPEWFRHRPDGSIRHAENPPKRYFDIYPINFDTPDRRALWEALLEVVLFWVRRGVRCFRVDNPHTKPFAFWQWLITQVHREDPGVIFLAEAFTRDTVRHRLSKVGFTQSYTDFTWRVTRTELSDYLAELSGGELPDWFRPNFWVNTPDILHHSLHHAPLSAFRLRLVLAALTSPSWGMYSGFELGENLPAAPGSEEYLDSEKYQYRVRRWDDPRSLAPLVTRLNGIRRQHREAIALLRTLRLHPSDNEQLLCVTRSSADGGDQLIVVVNLDPLGPQSGELRLDLNALDMPEGRSFDVRDALTGEAQRWRGAIQRVSLDPATAPGLVLEVVHP